jgi:1-hydroxycarotenoid 3,4-desaturase
MNNGRVVIVGAGVGGLAAAIDLSRQGRPVVVLEAQPRAGGKLHQREVGGLRVDAGPTVLTMRWAFDELFADAGRSLADYVTLARAETLARHVWPDGSSLDLYADRARSAEAVGALAGPAEARGYLAFSAHARRIYETVEGPFLRSQRLGARSVLRASAALGLGALPAIDAHRTAWRALGSFFHDPRLVQLFGRYATYVGSSPFLAPATLNLIAHVEQEGVWLVEGGMIRIAAALERLATELGAEVRTGAPVASIEAPRGRVEGVVLASGERVEASCVVMNGDVAALADGRLGPDAARAAARVGRRDRSLSAVTFAIAGRPAGRPLVRHNVFFSSSSPDEFGDLFDRRVLPREATVYVCAEDRDDAGRGPGGVERLFLIVNAPADGDALGPTETEIDACEARTFSFLTRLGLDLSDRTTVRASPRSFERLFPATGGALYGRATHGITASLTRPGARTRLPGLYLAGGSAHPGAGVPMALLSGRLAAQAIAEDLRSTPRPRAAATAGSTSTR